MYVALEDGTQLSSDVLLKAIQRFDLTPIPSTLELTLRIDASIARALAFDSVVLAGHGSDRYRVVKVQRSPDRTAQQGQQPDVLVITAVLDGFSALAWPLTRAVVKKRSKQWDGRPHPTTASTCQSGSVINHSPGRSVHHADYDSRPRSGQERVPGARRQ